ncbi:MAG: MATE family efflux transporter, partial [Ilumatobacter sp.]
TLVAESVGAGERPAARDLTRRTERLSLVAGLALALGLVATSGLLPHLFTSDIAVVDNAREAVVILGIMLVPGAIAFAGDGVLIGLGDYRFIGRLSFVTLLVVSPLYPVLARAGAGLGTLWLSLTGWMVLRAVSVHLRHRHLLDSRPVPQTP